MPLESDGPLSQEVLSKAVKNELDALPKNDVHAGVVLQNGDIGAEVAGEVDLGKGVFAEGEGTWFQRAGWRAQAIIGWRKK